MNDNSKFFDEGFKETAKEKVDMAAEVVEDHKSIIWTVIAVITAGVVGHRIGKKQNKKATKAMVDAAKEQAVHEYTESLIKETMLSSFKNNSKI